MSVFRAGQTPPAWCELRAFDIVELRFAESVDQRRRQPKERLLVTLGTVQVRFHGGSTVLKENQFLDLTHDVWTAHACSPLAQFVRLSGAWGEEVSGCGIFRVANHIDPKDGGDPAPYAKTTSVDSHYHDCDEYWIGLEGEGAVVVGDRRMPLRPGDCIAIGMGHHHDMPNVASPVKAVFFETTLEREKRIGHLWNHTHGEAVPAPERV